MKSKFIICYVFLVISLININNTFAKDLRFESSSVEYDNEKKIITAKDGVEIFGENNLKITAIESKFFKNQNLLKLLGNVKILDLERNILIESSEIIFYRDKQIFNSVGKTKILYDKIYKLNTSDLFFYRNEHKLSSKNESILHDNKGNEFIASDFNLNTKKKTVRFSQAELIDNKKNNFFTKDTFLDLNYEKLGSKDVSIKFSQGELGNNARLKGNSLFFSENKSIIKKGIFTSCKEREEDCPPWSITAEEITHDKKNKMINYKNSWLKLYDIPVFYFPKFFHPDPTVKRQSGFLTPSMLTSSTNGDSIIIPYYHVISENRDWTISPRVYFNNTFMIQNEYRQVEKNSDFIADFSLKKLDKKTKSHFFANAKHNFDAVDSDANIEINLERTSNDTYLRKDEIKAKTNQINQSLLNSFIKYENFSENRAIYLDANVYEDLTKEKSSDKFQYILPSFKVSNLIDTNMNLNGKINLINSGSINQSETNKTTSLFVNDLVFQSNSYYSSFGSVTNFNFNLKNTNKETRKNQTSNFTLDNYGLLSLTTKLPYKKKVGNYTSNLAPKLLLMYSPSKNENLIDKEKRINPTNIFSNNRLGLSDSLEGGQSITIGAEYDLYDTRNNEISANIGQIFRDIEDKRLPTKSKMRNKSSDIVGDLGLNLNDKFKISYNFSADNNLESMNYNKVETQFSINNFVTKFDFLEENNEIGNESYLQTDIKVPFKKNKNFYYKTRRNRKTDLTEYYNLIYEYKNDCLVAAIQYNKNYYTDRDLEPSENIFFSITFSSFTSVDSPNLIND